MSKKRKKTHKKIALNNKKSDSKKTVNKERALIPLILVLLAFCSRIVNLLALPPFNDELILLGWSKIVAINFWENLFYTIRADGHLPLVSWLYVISFKFFSHPVFAGRFVSVIAGTLSTLGVYLIGKHLYSEKVAVIASLLYIFTPLTFFSDRFAYFDSPMSFFGVYILLFSILLFLGGKRKRPLFFFGLGMSMGIGVLTKAPAVLMLSFPILTWFFLRKKTSINQLGLILAAYSFPALSYAWLFSDPYSWLIFKRGGDLTMSFAELLTFPFEQWSKNSATVIANWWYYLTPTLLLLFLYAIHNLIKYNDKRDGLLFWCFFLPSLFLAAVALGRVWFKYLDFTFPPLLILLGNNIERLSNQIYLFFKKREPLLEKKKTISIAVVFLLTLVLLIPSLRFDYFLLTKPQKAPFHPFDKEAHIESWSSGYGLAETISYLKEQSKKDPVVIVLPHPDIGVIHYGLLVLLDQEPNIFLAPLNVVWVNYPTKIYSKIADQIRPFLKGNERVFHVLRDGEGWPESFLAANSEAVLRKQFFKPGKKSSILIYEIPFNK